MDTPPQNPGRRLLTAEDRKSVRMTTPQVKQREYWTPDYWRDYWERENPYRTYKLQRDRHLAVQLLRPLDGNRILEVGCGYGRISQVLLSSASIRLVGVDFSEHMLKECKKTVNAQFVACLSDAVHLPFRNGSFDAVLCNGVLMHVEDQKLAMIELCRVLRPGGRLVLSSNNLLSPFAVPVILWIRLKSRVRQVFKPPWFYYGHLAKLGIKVRCMVGDTLLAMGVTIPGVGVSMIPHILFPALRVLDRWVDRPPLNYLAYENWFLGVKDNQETEAKP